MNSIRGSTSKQYAVQLKKWVAFCNDNDLHVHDFRVPVIIEFLTQLKNRQHLSYKSVSAARSAVGNYALMVHSKYDGLMNHPLISKLMKGMANLNPQIKTYQQIWNPQVVLQHLQNMADNQDLSLLYLSKKVAMLAALVTGSRCQTLHKLRRDRMTDTGDCFCCNAPLTLKTSKPDDKEQVIHLPKYVDSKLCVYSAVKHYKDITDKLRDPASQELFIISRAPFNPAAQSTVAGWIKSVMADAGIDTSLYTTHSTRKASTSQAADVSVPIGTIMKAAGWANSNTFARFYRLPVLNHDMFANAVLRPAPRTNHFNEQ